MAKLASPLFIVREECAADLFGALEKIAGIGFDGVEFLGLFGKSANEVKSKIDSLGLVSVGGHVSYGEFILNADKIISDYKTLGSGYITIGPPPDENMPGGARYAETISSMNKIGRAVRDSGMKLLFHNHAGELRVYGEKTILEHLMDDTDPELLFLEPDLGWIKIGGGDPMYFLDKYGARSPVVHFKDCVLPKTFRPTGYGEMENVRLYEKCLTLTPRPEWYVTDHDFSYERDPFFDLKISYEYFRNLAIVCGE